MVFRVRSLGKSTALHLQCQAFCSQKQSCYYPFGINSSICTVGNLFSLRERTVKFYRSFYQVLMYTERPLKQPFFMASHLCFSKWAVPTWLCMTSLNFICREEARMYIYVLIYYVGAL